MINYEAQQGNEQLKMSDGPVVAHLHDGRPIDLQCEVRYGLVAELFSGDK
jgi:hypothetical protein